MAKHQSKARESGLFSSVTRDTVWSFERIDKLPTLEVRALLENAQRLESQEIEGICRQVLESRPRGMAVQRVAARKPRKDGRKLVSRAFAFGMHGVHLANRFWSRSGVTTGGDVMFALWADDVKRDATGSRCLLWAPNTDGQRAWSDSPGGQERLSHCKTAVERGNARALLTFGTRLEGVLPEQKVASMDGVDAESILEMQVQQDGDAYWAVWGLKAA